MNNKVVRKHVERHAGYVEFEEASGFIGPIADETCVAPDEMNQCNPNIPHSYMTNHGVPSRL